MANPPVCDDCGHIAHAYDCLGVTLEGIELGNCKCVVEPAVDKN